MKIHCTSVAVLASTAAARAQLLLPITGAKAWNQTRHATLGSLDTLLPLKLGVFIRGCLIATGRVDHGHARGTF